MPQVSGREKRSGRERCVRGDNGILVLVYGGFSNRFSIAVLGASFASSLNHC